MKQFSKMRLARFWFFCLCIGWKHEAGAEMYQLSPLDLIQFSIQNEEETQVLQRIDGQGNVRLPYIGTVGVGGLTTRQAEKAIEKAYVEAQIFRNPEAAVRIIEYSVKEVVVLGEVKRPGKVAFPIEANSLNIVEVISSVGGFNLTARSREVRVTRAVPDGEQNFSINVERMLTGRGTREELFYVLPGDVIYVPERIF